MFREGGAKSEEVEDESAIGMNVANIKNKSDNNK